MAAKFALKHLHEHAKTAAETAAANLGALNRELQHHEQKLLMLFKYRDEYQQRLRTAARDGLDSAGLRNFHEFLDRLEQAIMQQHAVVVEARTRVDCTRSEWQMKERKSKAFGTLEERFDTAARRAVATHEQKLQDEFASRNHRGHGAKHRS